MGYEFRFEFKAKLRDDLPEEIESFLLRQIYGHHTDEKLLEFVHPSILELMKIKMNWHQKFYPTHKLFSLKRWTVLFTQCYDLPHPQLIRRSKDGIASFFLYKYTLELHSDINYGFDEINEFMHWIKPYISGSKKKQYVGWYRGEDQQEQINLYIER